MVGVSPKLAREYLELYERSKDKEGVRQEIEHLIRFNDVPLFEEEDSRKKGGVK